MPDAWIPDASAIATFRRDPEEFRLRYRQHLVKALWQEAPDSGRAFHTALDTWFGAPTSDVEAAVAALRGAWREEPMFGELRRPLALMERILRAYAERWPRERDPFTVEGTEHYVEATIARAGVSFPWCGIIDRRIRFEDGATGIMDTKTTSGWFHTPKTQGFFTRFEVAEAMLGYLALEQALDRDTRTYYIDAVHVDEITPKGGGKIVPDRDFARWRCPGLVQEWRLDRWALDMAWTLAEIKRLDEERGPDEPWPIYVNWAYGQPPSYFEDFYLAPPELRAANALAYERVRWEPREVAG